MSHFTYLKTRFQNLFYLEKALNRLNIEYKQELINDSKISNVNLVIRRPNGYDIKFCWNGERYDLAADMAFWGPHSSIKNFIDQIAKEYASEVVICESQKIGFQPIKIIDNVDNSKTLILERWNSAKSAK